MNVSPFQKLNEKLSTPDVIIIDLQNSYFTATVIFLTIKHQLHHLHHPSALANQGQKVSTGSNALTTVLELSSIQNTVFAHNRSARIASEQITKLMLKIEQILYVLKFPALK